MASRLPSLMSCRTQFDFVEKESYFRVIRSFHTAEQAREDFQIALLDVCMHTGLFSSVKKETKNGIQSFWRTVRLTGPSRGPEILS